MTILVPNDFVQLHLSNRWEFANPDLSFAVFLGVNVLSLSNGLADSAMSARADIVIRTALCLVQLVAVALVFPKEFVRPGRLRFGRRSNRDPSPQTDAP